MSLYRTFCRSSIKLYSCTANRVKKKYNSPIPKQNVNITMSIFHVSSSKMKNIIAILETPVIIGNAREETFPNATFIKS